MKNKAAGRGRKVFCFGFTDGEGLHVFDDLIRREYEAYRFEAPEDLAAVLRKFEHSVICIRAAGTEELAEWKNVLYENEEQCRDKQFRGVIICADSRNDPQLPPTIPWRQIPSCAIEEIQARLDELLEEWDSRGQRQYVRFGGTDEVNVDFSFSIKGSPYQGKVNDISSAGMSCAFDKDTSLEINQPIDSIQLMLQGNIYSITGRILLQRALDDTKRLFVVMFDRRMPPEIRRRLQDFIHDSLQAKMNALLEQER